MEEDDSDDGWETVGRKQRVKPPKPKEKEGTFRWRESCDEDSGDHVYSIYYELNHDGTMVKCYFRCGRWVCKGCSRGHKTWYECFTCKKSMCRCAIHGTVINNMGQCFTCEQNSTIKKMNF